MNSVRSLCRLTAILKEKKAEADAARKANEEAQARIAELENTAETHKAQAKASEMVSEELSDDCKLLINRVNTAGKFFDICVP
ncbi:hypothetical protein Hanom_Chr04g00356851 [Helianthus anomalus]